MPTPDDHAKYLREIADKIAPRRRQAEPEPPPVLPCPRCGKATAVCPVFYREGQPELPDWQVTVRGCLACQILCAHVEGIADLWRDANAPGALDRVVADGWDGLRQWRWLNDDEGMITLDGGPDMPHDSGGYGGW